ncbi:type II and III secretion system protein family protein [Marinomonas communis]|uniref:Pilus assembly protein CpaC n=1 Tax=Marinomonas communis TaxID=28254 RepID=A0A4R6X716_9GAMM|nr:pilus assembly protein N-terminal domain-containing protein [Marinomonas communis]TDR13114.1 pilus assembly protein CpaC [Marinomonas communis]
MIKQWFIAALLIVLSPMLWAQDVMNIGVGEAQALSSQQKIGSVFISAPNVADYQVVDKNKVIVFGRQTGKATVMLFSEDGATLQTRQIIVSKSMVDIQRHIETLYPNAGVKVYNLGDKVVLTGTVATEKEKDGIHLMVGELLGKSVENHDIQWNLDDGQTLTMDFMRRRSYEGIVNNIEVATTKQVNVKITVAEVSHSLMQNFGVNLYSEGQSSGVFVNPLRSITTENIISAITAINDDEVGQILAEPNLSVISGESASFLVGGEMPITTVVDDQVNVTYKEFGVRLEMLAKVLTDDNIRLSLMPEVSSVDTQYGNSTYNIPAFKTRRARTTVELADGQSFVLGGLLNSEERELLRKVPFIGDVPIIGSLFRYTETERNKTELIIVATVNLVKPIEGNDVALPTFQRTTNAQRFFVLPKRQQEERTPNRALSEEILSAGGFKK